MRHLKRFENYNNIEIESSGGLKCDNINCNWEDMSIPIEDYVNWVNKPCPECGDVVLTEDDFNKTNQIMNAIKTINSISPEELEKLSLGASDDDIIDAYLKLKELGIRMSSNK